jgi:hypothetical protein
MGKGRKTQKTEGEDREGVNKNGVLQRRGVARGPVWVNRGGLFVNNTEVSGGKLRQ